MGKLSKKEKEEMQRVAASALLKKDMLYLSDNRFNPLIGGHEINMDRLLIFLTEYNEFINHSPKPFKPIIDRIMKL
jgi:hypothetical protein